MVRVAVENGNPAGRALRLQPAAGTAELDDRPLGVRSRDAGELERCERRGRVAPVVLTGDGKAELDGLELLCAHDVRDSTQPIVEFRGAGRRLEPKGAAGGVAVLDSYAHHPAELAADLVAIRNGGRLLALFQPHLYSRTLHLVHGFAEALAGADGACVTEIYPAREEPVPGVTGRLIVDELARVRPGMPIGWAPSLEDAAVLVARWARPGDTVLTLGAGDVDRAAPLILEALA